MSFQFLNFQVVLVPETFAFVVKVVVPVTYQEPANGDTLHKHLNELNCRTTVTHCMWKDTPALQYTILCLDFEALDVGMQFIGQLFECPSLAPCPESTEKPKEVFQLKPPEPNITIRQAAVPKSTFNYTSTLPDPKKVKK